MPGSLSDRQFCQTNINIFNSDIVVVDNLTQIVISFKKSWQLFNVMLCLEWNFTFLRK